MIETIFVLFLVVWLIQMAYWLFFQRSTGKIFQEPQQQTNQTVQGVSVIICGKNEAHQITEHLTAICQQEYPLYEVIFIDDNSTDNTQEVFPHLLQKFPHLRTFKNESNNHWKGKKSALDYGISKAQYDAILVTDADCKPKTDQWIQRMMLHYNNNIALGYAPYYVGKIKFLPQWIQWETMHTFIQYSSYASSGNAYMGVGRNMLYAKSHYQKAVSNPEFLKTYNTIPSGDDDLLIQEMIKHTEVSVCAHPDTLVYSRATTNWASYWQQKSRHASTGKFYTNKLKGLLGLYGFTHGIMWLLGIALILYYVFTPHKQDTVFTWNDWVSIKYLYIVLLLLLNRIHIIRNTWNNFYKSIHGEGLTANFLLRGDLFWAIYNLILSPYIFIKNKQRWKY